MQLAGADFVIWLIIAIVVLISKAYGKAQEANADAEEQPAPPPRPRPRQAAPTGSAVRPGRDVERNAPTAVPPLAERRQEAPRDIREFIERLQRPTAPAPPPPVVVAPPPPPPPPAAKSLVEKAKEAQEAEKRAAPAPRPKRAQWAEALRDRENLRNIVVATEIIGPPRGA